MKKFVSTKKEIEETGTFAYLGANLSNKGGTDKDIDVRIKKVQYAFKMLHTIWSLGSIRIKLKY